jgi:hypothetical protein
MNRDATSLFDTYLADRRIIVRRELEFPPVAEFRKSLIGIFQQLDRADERQGDIAVRIWSIISRLMTSTAAFDRMLPDATECIFISPKSVKENWGHEIWANYDRAVSIAYSLVGVANPLAQKMTESVQELIKESRSFAIYCPKVEIPELQRSLAEAELDPSGVKVVSTVVDYRELGVVDTIIKVGPMRTQGRARTTDSLLTSPKCNSIIQLTWEKAPDEPSHGYDPIVPVSREHAGRINSALVDWQVNVEPVVIEWPHLIPAPTTEASGLQLSDDLSLLSGASKEFRSAVLLTLDSEYGMLCAPATRMVVYHLGQEGELCADVRSAAAIEPGSYIAVAGNYANDTLPDGQVGADNYSHVWKKKLSEAAESAPLGFFQKLEQAGLDLVGLRSAVKHWMQPTSTVIHAPQQRRHFEILCRVLDLTYTVNHRGVSMPFWRAAWAEISVSRGEAILEGMQNADKLESSMLAALRQLNGHIMSDIGQSKKFDVKIPFGDEGGHIPLALHKVAEVESGYRAPDAELRKILQLEFIQQWQ